MVTIAIMTIALLAIGYFFGGKVIDKPSALTVACVPKNISATSGRREQTYQLNIFVGGVKSIRNQYRASV